MKPSGEAVYKCTIAFLYTRKPEFAQAALGIIDKWATTNTRSTPSSTDRDTQNGPLNYGWMVASFAKSMEILKYTYDRVDKNIETRFNRWIDTLVLPMLKRNPNPIGNWFSTINEARLQLAIFREQSAEFNTVLQMCRTQLQRDIDADGIVMETFRDMWHVMIGLGALVQCCEIAFHQGFDIYGAKLKAALELHAAINLNPKGPYPAVIERHIQNSRKSTFKTVAEAKQRQQWPFIFADWPLKINWAPISAQWGSYEMFINHYKGRKNESVSLSERFVKRPEDYGFHVGYGTYTHYMPMSLRAYEQEVAAKATSKATTNAVVVKNKS
jgi:hypothetical protein